MAKLRELPDMNGRRVGRYEIVRHLASGGMAELYIARQQAMGGFEKPVVLKLLQPRYAEKPSVVTMFLDEARLAAKLNHPSIVHVYDVAEEGGMKYIAMEYIDGETVADIVKQGLAVGNYLPLEHAVHLVAQSAAGLAYAHERREPDGRVLRIVHRDVSPTNILVSYEGQTKIVDFGIARAQDELREESGILPGKASYMSPEQIRGLGADYRSDIFALGIILYELTLCQRLYRGAPEAVMRRIVEESITPPTAIKRDYPPALELIVMRALEKRPEDRYQSAEAMRDELEEFLDDSGLRTGNRRVSLYMNEVFPSEAGRSGRTTGGTTGGTSIRGALPEPHPHPHMEELDFDRRAPLSMRMEPADDAASTPRPTSSGATAARTPVAVAPRPTSPATPTVAVPPKPAATQRSMSWLIIAAFIVIGVAAMVIVTLK